VVIMPISHPNRTKSGAALTKLILTTFRFHGFLCAAGDEITAPFGLTSARWKVLGAIATSGRPLHVAQIARNMGITRQAVQRIVNELEKEGLVALGVNPDHQRASLVNLTDQGHSVYSKVMDEQIQWSNWLAEAFDEVALNDAAQVLAILCERFDQSNQESER
jgi:DNA-binding MarR family transcriptional regulator